MPPRYPFEFVEQLDDDQRQRFERAAITRAVKKFQPVIGQGAADNTDVFFVLEGEFKVSLLSPQGKEVAYRTIGPGELFGELAVLDYGPRTANVTAQTNGRVVQISGVEFKALLEKSPKASFWLARSLAKQVRKLTERIFEFSALNVRNRIRSELLRRASATVKDNQAQIRMPTHQELAALLITHREAVTRELNELEAQGLISRRMRELTVLDVQALFELLQRDAGDHDPDGPKPSTRKRRR